LLQCRIGATLRGLWRRRRWSSVKVTRSEPIRKIPPMKSFYGNATIQHLGVDNFLWQGECAPGDEAAQKQSAPSGTTGKKRDGLTT
jgi:hypothetical protein